MPYTIRPEDRLLVDEMRQRPHGRHSPDLQRVLNLMRSTPLSEGRYILVCTKPFREWKLARHGGRQRPIEILDETFASREAAEWAVFKHRWKELTGEDLN